jgi:hypothetical protein
MSVWPRALGVVCLVLSVVLLATIAAPAPAHAFDFFNPYVAIASAGVALLILGTYLVIANVKDSRKSADGDPWSSVAVMGPAWNAPGQWTSVAVMGGPSNGNGGDSAPLSVEESAPGAASSPRAEGP